MAGTQEMQVGLMTNLVISEFINLYSVQNSNTRYPTFKTLMHYSVIMDFAQMGILHEFAICFFSLSFLSLIYLYL